jgi:hypothetical protein
MVSGMNLQHLSIAVSDYLALARRYTAHDCTILATVMSAYKVISVQDRQLPQREQGMADASRGIERCYEDSSLKCQSFRAGLARRPRFCMAGHGYL